MILSFALCVYVSVAFIYVGVGTGKLFEIVTDLVGKSSKVAKGAGEMAQLVKCLPLKPEELSSNPQKTCEKGAHLYHSTKG